MPRFVRFRPVLLACLLLLAAAAGAQEMGAAIATPRAPARVAVRPSTTRFVAFDSRDVAPLVGTTSPRDYQFLGMLEADGYGSVVLSVAGWVPAGAAAAGGRLGMLLVPDQAFAREALEKEGEAPLSLRVEVAVERASAGRTVATSSARLPLAFPRWRVYLYNTCSSSLLAHSYAMLGD